jgi:hypothetical protein
MNAQFFEVGLFKAGRPGLDPGTWSVSRMFRSVAQRPDLLARWCGMTTNIFRSPRTFEFVARQLA